MMNDFNNPYFSFAGITPEEMAMLQSATTGLTESQTRSFQMIYTSKRKNPQDILLFTLLGFIGIAGVQRFITGQVGMGILYLFTVGFCYIGTIVDIINYKSLANEFNQRMMFESVQIARMGI